MIRVGSVVRNVGKTGVWKTGVVVMRVPAGVSAWHLLRRAGLDSCYVRRGLTRLREGWVVRIPDPRRAGRTRNIFPHAGCIEEVRDGE